MNRNILFAYKRQSGSLLVELMIVVTIIGSILAWNMKLGSSSDNQTAGMNQGDQQSSFQDLAGQFFLNNRTNIEAAMAGDPTQAAIYCLINVAPDGTGGTVTMNATKHTCTFDTTLLRAMGSAAGWPPAADVNTPSRTRFVAVARQIMSTDPVPVPTGADDMFIAQAQLTNTGDVMTSGTASFTGDALRAVQEAKAAMDVLGAAGGYIPPGKDTGKCQYNATVQQACGNGWVVNLSDFL